MNFYSLFYWITVADSVRKGFNVFSNIFTCFSVLSFIILVGFTIASINTNNSEKERNIYAHWAKNIKRFFIWSSTFCFITWMGYFFIPTKKDAVLIVAGGAVGNFIMKDTSAQKIPSEVMVLL